MLQQNICRLALAAIATLACITALAIPPPVFRAGSTGPRQFELPGAG